MNQQIKSTLKEGLLTARFNCAALALIDFKNETYERYQLINHQENEKLKVWFDLASVTKALTLGGAWLVHPEKFTPQMILLLEHRAGLPFWGRLSKKDWKQTVGQYAPTESETVYSDFGALRLTIEINEKIAPLYSITEPYRDQEVKFWRDLPKSSYSPFTGWRQGKLISGEVHDDNCYVIGEEVGHAGLFGTIDGLAKTLIRYNKDLSMIEKLLPLLKARQHRYVRGFDTIQDPTETLAGTGCSHNTFGHLGFTGTSFWIDAEKGKGWVLLTNGSYPYWYDRLKLNELRRALGSIYWKL